MGNGRDADTGRYNARYTPDNPHRPPVILKPIPYNPKRRDQRQYEERRVADLPIDRRDLRGRHKRRFDDRVNRNPPPYCHKAGRRVDYAFEDPDSCGSIHELNRLEGLLKPVEPRRRRK